MNEPLRIELLTMIQSSYSDAKEAYDLFTADLDHSDRYAAVILACVNNAVSKCYAARTIYSICVDQFENFDIAKYFSLLDVFANETIKLVLNPSTIHFIPSSFDPLSTLFENTFLSDPIHH